MTLLHLYVYTLAGVPTGEVGRMTLEQLLAPVRHLGLRVDSGPNVEPEGTLDALHTFVDEQPSASFTGRGQQGLEVTVSWHDIVGVGDISRTGSLSMHVKATAVDVEALSDAMVQLVDTLHAPMATLEVTNGPFRARTRSHRDTYQADKVGVDRFFDLERGLSGLAWRTVLGPALVEFFGAAALDALPSERAMRTAGGSWLLRAPGLPGEVDETGGTATLIEALGQEYFFDPVNSAEPEHRPAIPVHAPYAHRVRRRSADGDIEWHETEGTTWPDQSMPDPNPIDVWNATRSAYERARTNDLRHGYVPEIIVVLDSDGLERTAIVASPDVQYVIPEVDVVVAGPLGNQRWIDRRDLGDLLSEFDYLAADHAFSADGTKHCVGVAHWTDDKNTHRDALEAALGSRGEPVGVDGVTRLR